MSSNNDVIDIDYNRHPAKNQSIIDAFQGIQQIEPVKLGLSFAAALLVGAVTKTVDFFQINED